MSAPTARGSFKGGDGATASASTITATWSGVTGIAAGDTVLVAITWSFNGTTITTPTGWTLVTHPTGNSGNQIAVFSKTLSSGDITAGSQVFTFSAAARAVLVGKVYIGAINAGTPVANLTTTTGPAVSTGQPNSHVLTFFSNSAASGAPSSLSFANGTTDQNPKSAIASGANMGLAVGEVSATTAGSYGAGTVTGASGSATYQGVAVETWVTSTNHAPTANAGPDQSVAAGATVTLDATGSTDSDGDTLTYSWAQTSGPAVVLSLSTAAQPTFSAPSSATLVFTLTVSDGSLTGTDTVTITTGTSAAYRTFAAGNGATASTASLAVSYASAAPVVGDVALIEVVGNFNGNTLTTPTGWTLLTGPKDSTAGLRSYLFSKTLTSGDVTAGSVTFTWSTATRTIAVGALITGGSTPGTPVWNSLSTTAPSVSTTKTGSLVVLLAANSATSGQPNLLSFASAASPGQDAQARTNLASGANMGAAVGHLNADAVGPYGGGTITGASGSAAYHAYAVEVRTTGNVPPVADAGADKTVEAGALVTLDATLSSDPDGAIASTSWTHISGPSSDAALDSTSGSVVHYTSAITLAGATDVWQVSVTDNDGASSTNTVTVTTLPVTERWIGTDGTAYPMVTYQIR